MKRRMSRTFVVVLLLLGIFAGQLSAFAVEDDAVAPCSDGISSAFCSLTISESELASGYLRVNLRSGYTADITLSLQKDIGSWATIKTWNTSGSNPVVLDKSYYVAPGYSYRCEGYIKLYDSDGDLIEIAIMYSNTVAFRTT